jgi:hypothetical protein
MTRDLERRFLRQGVVFPSPLHQQSSASIS